MKVILFLAAVYALIINQSQQAKPPVSPQPGNYTKSHVQDTSAIKVPVISTMNYTNYLPAQPSVIMHVAIK